MKHAMPAFIALIALCTPALADVAPFRTGENEVRRLISAYQDPGTPSMELTNIVDSLKDFASRGNKRAQEFMVQESLVPDPALDGKNSLITLLKKRCDLRENTACYLLYDIYQNGHFGVLDPKRALSYARLATEAESVTGYLLLGDSYRDGEGTPKDFDRARACYQKALNAGSPLAQEKLKALDALAPQGAEASKAGSKVECTPIPGSHLAPDEVPPRNMPAPKADPQSQDQKTPAP